MSDQQIVFPSEHRDRLKNVAYTFNSPPSFTEESVVHTGGKSMPLFYDNNKQGFSRYSETELTLSSPHDWTAHGVGVLSLWFRGIAGNAAEPLYVAVSNGNGTQAVVVNGDPSAATIDAWTEWTIDLSEFVNQGVNLSDVDKIAIGLGTKGNLTAPGGSGNIFIDDIRLYRPISQP